ncbi:hypothetical protein T458_01240 [Brevibacillus panacihumi W25]|uniref:Uncharacterized protein n=1 Tax=Brevibacillus panacihumi W25 TaxID=1408254 RepID=V6MFP5_9BACL|nr:hypothetical protein T458_01240 [Brevibacillus panacihumi W25]
MGEGIWLASWTVLQKTVVQRLVSQCPESNSRAFIFFRKEEVARNRQELHTKHLQGKVKFLTGGDGAFASKPATRKSCSICD